MSLTDSVMSLIGFKKNMINDTDCVCGGEVEIQDGKIIGNPYQAFESHKDLLTTNALNAAYEKVSCVGSSIKLISDNIQMIEPVYWNNEKREAVEYPSDRKLKALRKIFEKPNAIDNRKTFLDKCVKNFNIHGVIYFAFYMSSDKQQVISIKIIDTNLVSYFVDKENARISSYLIQNAGIYSGQYTFTGSYYVNDNNSDIILAPYINPRTDCQYLPTSPIMGAGVETLMYWYGCYHNKSMLENGARPSMIVLIKSLLNPKHREQLKQEIKVKHAGAGNAGSAIIIDGAAEKEIKQLSQNNKDMEFGSILSAAEDGIYRRLGTNWVLGRGVSAKDFDKGMEKLYDMTVCPLFQGIYNHLFDVYKYYNSQYDKYSIFYLEQDIPALRGRFIEMMSKLPQIAIFTINERRKLWNYKPLEDERGDELVTQTVSVYQQGMSPDKSNTTSFGGDANDKKEDNKEQEQDIDNK